MIIRLIFSTFVTIPFEFISFLRFGLIGFRNFQQFDTGFSHTLLYARAIYRNRITLLNSLLSTVYLALSRYFLFILTKYYFLLNKNRYFLSFYLPNRTLYFHIRPDHIITYLLNRATRFNSLEFTSLKGNDR